MIEIIPVNNLNAAISVPGSKYIANRLLIICALADGTSVLRNVPNNDDINTAIDAIKQFGIKIEKNNDALTIHGANGNIKSPKNEINVGDSGTLLRFIAGFAALAKGKTKITGSKRIQERPISDLLKSLNDLGIKSNSKNGHAPIIIEGGSLKGGKTTIRGNKSSQFISSLLMISSFAKNDVEISLNGKLVSSEYVDLTINLMKEFGVKVERIGNRFKIKSNQKYKSKNFTIPTDWASANYFLAAAAIAPGKIRINNLDLKSRQPESGFIALLVRMGCKVRVEKNSIEMTGANNLKGIEAEMSSMPDSAQTLAVVALFADGKTRIRNIGNLRFKESDRINDTANELSKLGADVKVTDSGMEIIPRKLKSATINPHNDHRMAMSFAIAGLRIPGIKIDNPECVNKSFPKFWQKLDGITGINKQRNVVLIGYRGAGKTSIANELSKLTGMQVISTDNEISKKVRMKLEDFINKFGWKRFRQVESEIIGSLENIGSVIIDCGGGIVENSDNIKLLKQNGIVFWLKAPVKVLAERIKDTRNRPSITGKKSFTDEIEEVLERRTPLYKKAADFAIETANKIPIEVAKAIMELSKNQIKTQICGVITADNVKDALTDIKKAASADLVELRLDFIKNIDNNYIKSLIKNLSKPVIVTCRPVKFGGLFKGNEKGRFDLLKTASDNGADFIDVEFQSGIMNQIINNANSKIIISHHDFEETPSLENLNSICNKIKELNPDIVKLVTTANSINDNFTIFKFLENKNDLIAFCMGQKGEISRILAPKFGSRVTYASLEKGKESAPGQIAIGEMKNLYHVNLINKNTNAIGIIGEFAENSMSKHMHNPNFVKNNANFVYVPFKVMKNELKEFMENFRKFSFKGAAVTIPHKEKIINYIDELDEIAEQIGATNTLVNNNGKITAYNTDYYGAVMALKEITKINNKKILILGAGGAARAVVYGLKKEGAKITIANRTDKKARKLANEFKVSFDKFNNIQKLVKNNDIIINTTSVGMSPNENQSVLDENDLVKGKIVMDIVYKPVNTKLIRLARKKGCKTITGDRMLIYQAVRQFELWTQINPGFKDMEKELVKQISKGD